MIRIVLAFMIGGGVLMYFGFREMQLSSVADTEPQTITAADLIANGPGENAHVKVTDFTLLLHETLMLTPEDNPNQYDKVWAPVIPIDDPYVGQILALGEFDQPPAFRDKVGLILYSKDIDNERELFNVQDQGTVQGLVINKIDKLSGDELKEFQKSLNVDPNTVLVLELDRKPSSGKGVLMLGGGAVLFLIGPGLFLLGRNK